MVTTANGNNACWNEFLDFCNRNARDNKWFRGVSSKQFKLIPKIGRGHELETWNTTTTIGRGTINLGMREKRLFEAFRRRARLGLDFLPNSDLEWLAIAQHHGVPTRLLDWTTNPLMAAWFATNISLPDDDQIARVHCISVKSRSLIDGDAKPFDPNMKDVRFIVAPHWHPRVRAQRGCFSIHPEPNVEYKPPSPEYFEIAREHWGEFRRRLYYFGIDASTVMADLSGLGEALGWQYETRTGIGQVGY